MLPLMVADATPVPVAVLPVKTLLPVATTMTGALQLAVLPPAVPKHDQSKLVAVGVTSEAFPAAHNSTGEAAVATPLAAPHAPLMATPTAGLYS